VPWAFLATLPGMLLTRSASAGARHRQPAGTLAGARAALLWFAGDHAPLVVRVDGWLPLLPDRRSRCAATRSPPRCCASIGARRRCVYFYSLSYMRGDPGQRRFFALLDFFVLAMNLLVLAGNLGVLVAGWAGVGLASFLLISFWRDKRARSAPACRRWSRTRSATPRCCSRPCCATAAPVT
jgi:hypothetical protein